MRVRIVLSIVLGFGLIIDIMILGLDNPARAHTLIVTANYTKVAPRGLDDPAWNKAKAAQLLVEGREQIVGTNGTVTTRALYTDDSLYFLFKWKDTTYSVKKQSWKFDGQKWFHLKGNEDRIALLFEITRINKFATRGCAIT